MAREFKRFLFNKNHIMVQKIDNPEFMDAGTGEYTIRKKRTSSDDAYFEKRLQKTANTKSTYDWKRTIKKLSPLGFYYMSHNFDIHPYQKEELKNVNKPDLVGDTTKTLVEITINFEPEKVKYVITYLIEYHGAKVSVDTRPWEIADNKSMEDHYVADLLKVLNDIFTEAKEHKTQVKSDNDTFYRTYSFNDIQRDTYTEIFGSPEDPKFMSNNEKILAHGFDLKESFRGPNKIK